MGEFSSANQLVNQIEAKGLMKIMVMASTITVKLDALLLAALNFIKGPEILLAIGRSKNINKSFVKRILMMNLIVYVAVLLQGFVTLPNNLHTTQLTLVLTNLNITQALAIPSLYLVAVNTIRNSLDRLSSKFSDGFYSNDVERLRDLRRDLVTIKAHLREIEGAFSPELLVSIGSSIILLMANICLIAIQSIGVVSFFAITMLISSFVKLSMFCFYGQKIPNTFEKLVNLLEMESIRRLWKSEEMMQLELIKAMKEELVMKAAGYMELSRLSAVTLSSFILQYSIILIQTDSLQTPN